MTRAIPVQTWSAGPDFMFLDQFKTPFKLENKGIRLPEFILSETERAAHNIPDNASNHEILTIIARAGYKTKLDRGLIPKDKAKEYGDRFKKELEVLKRTSFTDYILIVWDVMAFARRENLARGMGRGSAAGSLINYLIGITDIDPIKHGLFFERFISETRAKANIIDGVTYLVGSMPDIDMDFGDEDRDKVINYVSEKYKGKFVKLSTTGTLTTKILIKDLGKIVGKYSEDQMNVVSDYIPMVFGKVYSPQKCYEESADYKKWADQNPLVHELAQKLHECINHTGSHASAYLISYDNLEEFMPCQLGSENEKISGFDMYEAGNLAVKLDLLGVQSINLVYSVAKDVGLDLEKIDVDSWDSIYKYIQMLEHPYGLFQISGHTAVRALNKIKPKSLAHLSGVLAIARPGALKFVDEYADYTNNGTITPVDKLFEDVLNTTGGVCLYQEQIMALFVKLGFSLEDANTLRDIIGKKKTDKIAEWEPKIYAKAKENGISEESAKYVWSIALASADYSFNLSHSVSYAVLTAISIYCKFNYPKEFFLEALRMSQKKQDPFEQITLIESELPYFGIQLLPPDLVKSKMDFQIEGLNIRYGLSAIKGVAEKAIIKLQSFIDKDKANKFEVFQAAKNSGLNIGIISALIQSGCLSSLCSDRARAVFEAQIWYKLLDRERNYCLSNGAMYGFDLINALKDYSNWNDGKAFKESRIETIRKNTAKYNEIYTKNSRYPLFAAYAYEKALLGYSHSTTLRKVFQNEHPDLVSVDTVRNYTDRDQQVDIVATVIEIKKSTSKAGNNYMKVVFADETGSMSGIMVGEKFNRFAAANELPKEDEIVYIQGSKNDDGIWINRIQSQNYKIAFRARDLKSDEEEN